MVDPQLGPSVHAAFETTVSAFKSEMELPAALVVIKLQYNNFLVSPILCPQVVLS